MNSPTDLAFGMDRGEAPGTDTSEPLASIVIPCYNHARYLGEAIESALTQTHPHLEVVVVDDGSTDDTAAVAARYASARYVRQENQGLSAARNTGIRHSRGRYLIFLDADDRLLPKAIEAGLQVLEAYPESAFAFGTFRWIDARGIVTGRPEPADIDGDPYLAMLRRNYISMHATVMYRRALLVDVGGFATDIRACEDYDLFLRLTRLHPVHQHAAVVAEYRQHDANMSSNLSLMGQTALEALRRQRKFVRADQHRRQAYWEGVQFWEMCYGVKGLQGFRSLFYAAPSEVARRTARRAVEQLRSTVGRVIRRVIPGFRRRPSSKSSVPPVGHVRFGDLRRVQPLDSCFGFERGTPIDRYYIERFLAEHACDVRGRVLEIKDAAYTRQFGSDRVLESDVLDVDPTNPFATVVADLTAADAIQSDTYDCVLLTQTLQFIYDVPAALATVHRILKPGGVALATVPGITKTDASGPWYWTFTTESAQRLFAEAFPDTPVTVEGHGNVLAATAFLMGLAVEEFTPEELDVEDRDYRVCIAVRAVKPGVEE